ncbi:zinc finger BED domain-containing protein RICESLEEPER 2 [Spinacia oleracea]|uniref:Zinc finger BED domain-containing protein RICESLEEPER 2 n=1 Tax=Spinacia oleracea TaxID=3562 RepID=A0ABM3QZ16_SPIOL|nr:zinc finger BED domain-containing protein RICESLEEPER 2-like [Spinacia oleracea]
MAFERLPFFAPRSGRVVGGYLAAFWWGTAGKLKRRTAIKDFRDMRAAERADLICAFDETSSSSKLAICIIIMSNQVEEAVPDVAEAVSASSRKLKKSKRKMKYPGETSGLTYHKFDAASVRKALAYMIVADELPFKFVEGIGFRYFCSMMEPRFHVPSRIIVAKDYFASYLIEKRKLKHELRQYNEWKFQKRILNFCPITSHKGEEIGKQIEKCFLEWELEKNFCIIVDNASSNDTAIGYMRRKINGWKSGVLKGRFLHMRCVAHIVNLVVSDGMKTVNESITRVRHAVRFIKKSPSRLLRFKKCVSDEKIVSKKLLCLDVPTRWNSTYLMLSAAISLESAFERYAEEDPHYTVDLGEREGKGISESEDWNSVKKFSEFVQTFYDLTNRVSGSLYVTSNLFFHELVNVAVLLKELTSSDDPDMCLMACKMKEKYEKYWGDPEKINLMIFVAVVLDPRYKFDYVEWMLTEIYDVITASIWARNVKDILSALFEEYRILPQTDVVREEVSSTKDDTQLTTSHKKVEVLKSKYKKHKCEPSGAAKIELDKYLEEDKRTMMNLIFWGGRSSIVQRFPTMGRMARDVLAVPISTVASESAFSTKGRVLDNFRSSLSPVVVQGLVCNQNWLRAGPFQGVEECLEEVELLEEVIQSFPLAFDVPARMVNQTGIPQARMPEPMRTPRRDRHSFEGDCGASGSHARPRISDVGVGHRPMRPPTEPRRSHGASYRNPFV